MPRYAQTNETNNYSPLLLLLVVPLLLLLIPLVLLLPLLLACCTDYDYDYLAIIATPGNKSHSPPRPIHLVQCCNPL
jgi:hypothetical protein